MARLARLTLPGQVHHVMHRGNNRQAVVLDDTDREALLDLLQARAEQLKVAVHAYVLMPDHFQLLCTPSTTDGVPRLMQGMGRDYVRHFNRRHGRSGTLWEGRYRSTLIQAERHLMPCMAFIDLDPVREGLSPDAQSYPWSSHRHYAGLAPDRRITPHALYWGLGNTPFAREAAYADLVRAGLNAQEVGAIADALWHGWALGDGAYMESLGQDTDRRLSPARPGRPKKPLS
ncbi:transposase [Hydrogenophaga pseudoflava]|uniref:transposase n=1 Tax=Hydrogenophaga pseudoflava TaxID=47421 RepID=UPI0027E50F8B|nr:transposase [Hydrogenophaga pseudoflava]MDQ7743472.1 transposase [Hydrogenophaga pseudoflava]